VTEVSRGGAPGGGGGGSGGSGEGKHKCGGLGGGKGKKQKGEKEGGQGGQKQSAQPTYATVDNPDIEIRAGYFSKKDNHLLLKKQQDKVTTLCAV
jgi:hypothetical protein